ncbi:hypothetical protein SUGI_0063200, partial [Cryptomeria japonica]
GANIQLEIEGSGFFYKQVRNMVALLLEIGKEAVPAEVVFDVLASCDRRTLARHCIIVPPQGIKMATPKPGGSTSRQVFTAANLEFVVAVATRGRAREELAGRLVEVFTAANLEFVVVVATRGRACEELAGRLVEVEPPPANDIYTAISYQICNAQNALHTSPILHTNN